MTSIVFENETTQLKGWAMKMAHFGELSITLGLSDKAQGASAEFLPNKVELGKDVLWTFDKSFVGHFAFLREVGDEPMIVYASRTEVAAIVPLSALRGAIRTTAGFDFKMPAAKLLDLKIQVAEQMRLGVRLTPTEQLLKKHLDARAAAAARAATAALVTEEAQKKEERRRLREARRQAIMKRHKVYVYDVTGKQLYGIPVVGDEWQCLNHAVDCVTVDSYDEGKVGEVREHFFVYAKGSQAKSRKRVVAVTLTDPLRQPAAPSIEQMGEVLVDIEGNLDVLPCYTTAGLRQLQAEGLNSGALRGRWPLNNDGTISVVSFAKGGIKDVGNFLPLS